MLKSPPVKSFKKKAKTGQIFTKIKCGHEGCNFSGLSISSIKSHREEMNHPRKKSAKSPENLNTLNMAKRFKQNAIKKILRREAKHKSEYETGALLPNGMPRKWRFCGFEGCDYRTQYKANLNRHQNHYGHRDININETETIKKDHRPLDVRDNELFHVSPPHIECKDSNEISEKDNSHPDGLSKTKR